VRRRSNRRAKKTKYSRFKRKYVPKFRAPLGNFAATKTVALRYVQDFTLDASGTASATRLFAVNSIFDPDKTGAGHQPMFRDNYAAIYGTYRVNYATITVIPLTTQVVNNAYSNDVAGTTVSQGQFYAQNERGCRLWILREQSGSDYPNDVNTLIEEGNKNFVWRFCPQNTSQRMPTLRFSCWPHMLYGIPKRDPSLQAIQGSDPALTGLFIVGMSSIGGAANPDNLACQCIITYNVTYTDLIKNQSSN